MAKNPIRKATGNFLNGIPNNNYAFKIDGQSQSLTTAQDTAKGINSTNENLALTGAANALLPMQISTIGTSVDKNGQKISKRLTFTLLINPDTWNHSKSNSTQVTYARNGWVVQPWGPNQDTISSTGSTAGFMVPSVGFTNIGSEMSFGYLNFMSLVSAYKNNGYEFQDFTQINEATRVIKMIHGIQISYDNNVYMGHFNNFTINEDETKPFGYGYNFEFIISALDGTEFEVRGHYQKLPASEMDLQTGTEADPRVSLLVGDTMVKPLGNPPQVTEDGTTRRLWEQKTGLPWADAVKLHFTDGSFQGNLNLRTLIMSKTWDKTSKKFV